MLSSSGTVVTAINFATSDALIDSIILFIRRAFFAIAQVRQVELELVFSGLAGPISLSLIMNMIILAVKLLQVQTLRRRF